MPVYNGNRQHDNTLTYFIKDSQMTTQTTATVNASISLNEIVDRITVLSHVIATSSIEIGELLTVAKGKFGTTALFLEWAEKYVGYKKAYVYRFIAIYNEFGDKPFAKEMSVTALAALLGANADVVQIVEAAVNNGETITRRDVEEISAEASDEPQGASNLPAEQPVELDAKRLAKELDKAAKALEVEKQRHSVQIEKAKLAKDEAIKASRKAQTDLEKALDVIEKQAAELAAKDAKIAELEAALEASKQAPVDTLTTELAEMLEVAEQASDDLPWETEEDKDADKVAAFETAYLELLAASPRAVVKNTDEAAKRAGIDKVGKHYALGTELLTGAELRALIA